MAMATATKKEYFEQIGQEETMSQWNSKGDIRKGLLFAAGYPDGKAGSDRAWGHLKQLGWITPNSDNGGEKVAKPRIAKAKGCLSLRVESWLDDQEDAPEGGWTAEAVLKFVEVDSPAWNRKIRQCGDEEIAALELWLGHGATMSRHEGFLAEQKAAETLAGEKKIASLLIDAMELANTHHDTLGCEIAALLTKYCFKAD